MDDGAVVTLTAVEGLREAAREVLRDAGVADPPEANAGLVARNAGIDRRGSFAQLPAPPAATAATDVST